MLMHLQLRHEIVCPGIDFFRISITYFYQPTFFPILKGQNVLLTADKKTVKLIDFEISKQLGVMTRTMTTAGRGTVYYMAPEVAKHDYYGVKSDIW